jgi:hypothetical protein
MGANGNEMDFIRIRPFVLGLLRTRFFLALDELQTACYWDKGRTTDASAANASALLRSPRGFVLLGHSNVPLAVFGAGLCANVVMRQV